MRCSRRRILLGAVCTTVATLTSRATKAMGFEVSTMPKEAMLAHLDKAMTLVKHPRDLVLAELQPVRDAVAAAPDPPPPPTGTLVKEDPCIAVDPVPLWGAFNAGSPTRHQLIASGGPDGGPFRRITVQDGDNIMTATGERAELGKNDWRGGLDGTFMLYYEGEHKTTRIAYRLPNDFAQSASGFNNIWQMKHANPSDAGPGAGPLSLQVRDGEFRLYQNIATPVVLWSMPVVLGEWITFTFDITYSQHPDQGRITVWAGGTQFPEIEQVQTLIPEVTGADGIPKGDSIPAFLAAGIYHQDDLPGTSIDIARVRVEAL